jgi:uncharacterized protein YndB with AHSA1/START domain
MPQNKDLKRLVRSRMKKTGESYTAARAHLTRRNPRTRTTTTAVASPPDYAALAGMSDDAVKAATGCAWDKWVRVLDRAGAMDMTHAQIAALVHTRWNVPGWWSQTVTVGYERIKGLRAIGQRRSGAWEASKSRTFPVPVDELFEAWADAKTRARWLPEKITVRRITPNRSMRITWPDRTSLELWFQAKGGRSTVGVQHTKLTSKSDVEERKKYWTGRLAALNELLTG